VDLTESPDIRHSAFRPLERRFGRRLWRTATLVAAILLVGAGVASGSNATKGGSYGGTYAGRQSGGVSFKVSPNGKRVVDLIVSTPFKCGGGCGGVPSPGAGSATISKQGKFKATLTLFALGSTKKSIGSDTVTGTFLKNGEATGTVTSHFNASSAGETVNWSAVTAIG
jgi:hypothetical protein